MGGASPVIHTFHVRSRSSIPYCKRGRQSCSNFGRHPASRRGRLIARGPSERPRGPPLISRLSGCCSRCGHTARIQGLVCIFPSFISRPSWRRHEQLCRNVLGSVMLRTDLCPEAGELSPSPGCAGDPGLPNGKGRCSFLTSPVYTPSHASAGVKTRVCVFEPLNIH